MARDIREQAFLSVNLGKENGNLYMQMCGDGTAFEVCWLDPAMNVTDLLLNL